MLWLAGAACSATELDETLDGVFPCATSEDCPPESACVAGTCFHQSAPRIEIVSPEEELVIGHPGAAATMMVPISLRAEGLELARAQPGADAAFGVGYLEISVDDVPVAIVESGGSSPTVALTVEIEPEPGGHVLKAAAFFPDGTPYDNADAVARRLFWIDDGRPHVAMKEPWSQARFGTGAEQVPVEVATLNFNIAPPEPTTTHPGLGHVHFYWDVDLPACAFETGCDGSFIGIAAPEEGAVRSLSALVSLPPAPAGSGRLSAVLRRLDHTPYLDENGYPIWTDVVVRRVGEDD